MFNFDYILKKDIKEYSLDWLQIPDHPCGILIVGGSRSGKINALLKVGLSPS